MSNFSKRFNCTSLSHRRRNGWVLLNWFEDKYLIFLFPFVLISFLFCSLLFRQRIPTRVRQHWKMSISKRQDCIRAKCRQTLRSLPKNRMKNNFMLFVSIIRYPHNGKKCTESEEMERIYLGLQRLSLWKVFSNLYFLKINSASLLPGT